MSKCIGILTAGGDSPGLNAAIRSIGKTLQHYDIHLLGFKDGFEGLVYDKTMIMDEHLSGILTAGGTILGTSRNKPHKMPVGKNVIDMTDAIVDNYNKHQLDGLVCIGGGGTHKSAFRLAKKGLNVITLPKTIDNDLALTDTTIGFDTALNIATGAIDSLHSTASSHKRIILVEIMGHRAGWLTLEAGLAGGADAILIPEIPYDIRAVARAIQRRARKGKLFSLVPVAEGAISKEDYPDLIELVRKKDNAKGDEKEELKLQLENIVGAQAGNTVKVAQKLEEITGQETRVTILGHLQRGGTPTPADRLLATKLGNACASFIREGKYGVMVAARGDSVEAVPLEDVAGKVKLVPPDHELVKIARETDVCLGDK